MKRIRMTLCLVAASVVVTGAVLAAAALKGNGRPTVGPAVGTMPEVLVSAPRLDRVVDEIVVRPADVVSARLGENRPGIN
jgi:hypothetical protein